MLQDASRVCVAVLRCMFHVHIHKACAHMRTVYCTVDYSIRTLAYPYVAIESLYLCRGLVCVLQRIKVSRREVTSPPKPIRCGQIARKLSKLQALLSALGSQLGFLWQSVPGMSQNEISASFKLNTAYMPVAQGTAHLASITPVQGLRKAPRPDE